MWSLCLLLLLVGGAVSNLIRLSYGSKGVDAKKSGGASDAMTMEIPVDGGLAVLNLRKSDVVSADVPVLLGTYHGTFIMWQPEADSGEDFALYVDPDNGASFVTWSNSADGKQMTMGVFNHHGNVYSVEPMDGRMESGVSRPLYGEEDHGPEMVTLNGVTLSLTRVDRTETSPSDTGLPLSEEALQRQQQVRSFLQQHPQDAVPNAHYEVEILVVIDYSVFMKFIQKSRSFDYKTREAEAINSIRYYFAEILNGVALRYKLMSDGRIRLRPVGFFVAKSEDVSYWTELPPFKEDYHFTNASGALGEFTNWLNQEKSLPSFDYAILFTENALVGDVGLNRPDDVRRRLISGLSDVMAICQRGRTSICHDGGLSASIDVASWEFGNILGAYNDTSCQSQVDRKSSLSSSDARRLNSDYPLHLSDCSKRALWGYLNYLSLNGTNCLLQRNDQNGRWSPVKFLQRYPGQRYTSDEQCRLAHGTHSFSCIEGALDKSVCSMLHCWIPFKGKCEPSKSEAAADGTPCGDGLWCMKGQCVQHDDAPTANDLLCAHGDYSGVVDPTNGYRCYEIGLSEPYRCYDDYFRASCCDTCNRVRRSGQAADGCEYGNKDPEFCDRALVPSDCYKPDVRDKCCETCARYRINLTGCEYGDKSRTCRTAVVQKYICYDSNSTCCLTCPRLQVGLKGCEWGDRISQCRGNRMNKCYDTAFSHSCCGYCNQLRIGPVGCEWGDRVSSCTRDDCLDPDRRKDCCKTCSSLANHGTAATTKRLTKLPAKSTVTPPSSTTSTTEATVTPPSSTASTTEAMVTPPSSTTSTTKATVTPSNYTTSTTEATVTLSNYTTEATVTPSNYTTEATVTPSNYTTSTTKATVTPSNYTTSTTKATVTPSNYTTLTLPLETITRSTNTTQPPTTTTVHHETTTSQTPLPSTKETTKTTSTDQPSTASTFVGKTKKPVTKAKETPLMAIRKTTPSFKIDEPLVGDILESDIIAVSDEACQDNIDSCYQIRGGYDCYSRHQDCCATCKQYETTNPICPYGNKISWCERYVSQQGKIVCDKDPYVRSECCGSCGADIDVRKLIAVEECIDKASWCGSIFPGQCYDSVTRKTCCAKCSSLRTSDSRCLYGDVYSWCNKRYCRTEARQCCQTCKES